MTTDGNKAFFVNYNNSDGVATAKHPAVKYGESNLYKIKSMHLANNYILLVYNDTILIYNKSDGVKLQTIAKE